jgi:hypothetical protein
MMKPAPNLIAVQKETETSVDVLATPRGAPHATGAASNSVPQSGQNRPFGGRMDWQRGHREMLI